MTIERTSPVGHFDTGIVVRAWMVRLGNRVSGDIGDYNNPRIHGTAAMFMLSKVLEREPTGEVEIWNRWVPDETGRLKMTNCKLNFDEVGMTKKVMNFITLLNKRLGHKDSSLVAGMLDKFTIGRFL